MQDDPRSQEEELLTSMAMVHSQVSPSLQRVVGLSVSLLVSKTTSHSVESFTVQHLSWKMLMMEKGEAFNKFGQGDLVHTGKGSSSCERGSSCIQFSSCMAPVLHGVLRWVFLWMPRRLRKLGIRKPRSSLALSCGSKGLVVVVLQYSRLVWSHL